MDVMSKFNLPNYLKGKTFAEASKLIDDKFKDRTDPESIATMNEMQSRLKTAQEFVKQQHEARNKPAETPPQPSGDNQMFLGGLLEGADAARRLASSAGGLGDSAGAVGGLAGGAGDAAGAASGAAGSGVGAAGIMGAATGALKLASLVSDNKVDMSGKTRPESVNKGARAVEGAAAGAQVGGAIVPGLGHAIGAVGGGLLGGLTGASNEDITAGRANNTYAEVNKAGNNIARYGLDLGSTLSYLDDLPKTAKAMDASGMGAGITDLAGNVLSEVPELESGSFGPKAKTPSLGDYAKFGASKLLSPENLRYAPAAMNIAQLSSLDKPEDVSFGRSNKVYDQQLVDEQGLQNTVRQATASNRDAILSSAGGSSSKARAALLGSQLQGTKALSDAYQRAGAENRQEAKAAQAFDSAIEQFNIAQADKSQLTNLKQRAAYETNRSKLLAQIGQELGGVGREELFKKYPELAGLGYDGKGKKIKK